MAKLDLSTFTGMMEGSASGPVIAPGKPERSLLWKMIENGQMPQGGKLSAADKQSIQAYIQFGRVPIQTREMEAALLKKETARITQKDRDWWSFQKPVKTTAPVVKDRNQVRTEVDAFILAQLERRAWRMQKEASRPALIRRATYDLTGFPPTPEEVKSFVEDPSPNA